MEAEVSVVAVVGSRQDQVQLLVSQLTACEVPEDRAVLPAEPGSSWDHVEQIVPFFHTESRTLYLQVVVPVHSKKPDDATGLPSGGQAARSLHAFFQVLLSCHLLVWLPNTSELRADQLGYLQSLQTAKLDAAAELGPLLPLKATQRRAAGSGKSKQQQQGGARSAHAVLPPQLLLAFPNGQPASDAKTVQAQEALLEQQVRSDLAAAGSPSATAAEALFCLPEPQARAAYFVPSAEANLRAAFDAAYAGLTGPKGAPSTLTGTAATFAHVRQHIQQAMSGLHGSGQPGAAGAPSRPLPTLAAWLQAFRELNSAMEAAAAASHADDLLTITAQHGPSRPSIRKRGRKESAGRLSAALLALDACADPVWHASRTACVQAAAEAFARYTSKAPDAYPEATHAVILQPALAAFQKRATGPAVQMYKERLQQACLGHWQQGRQQCGTLSTTGLGCVLPPARQLSADSAEPADKTGAWDSLVDDQAAGDHSHSSGQQYLLADVSGLRRCTVADPFSPATANATLLAEGTNGQVTSYSMSLHEQASASSAQPGKENKLQPMPSPPVDPFADSPPAQAEQQQKQHPTGGFSDQQLSRHGRQQQAAELGKWLHVYVSPVDEHEQSLEQEGNGWVGDATKGLTRLELPPLGAESAAQAPATEDADSLSAAEFPPLPPTAAAGAPASKQQHASEADKHPEYRAFLKDRWWPGLASIGSAAAPAQPRSGKRKGGRRGGKQEPPQPLVPSAASGPVVTIGLEYESLQGRRSFCSPAAPPSVPARQQQQPCSLHAAADLLTRDVPLFIEAPLDKAAASGARGSSLQLRRIHVLLPKHMPCRLACKPVIQIQVGASLIQYSISHAVELQPEACSVITLPWTYVAPSACFASPHDEAFSCIPALDEAGQKPAASGLAVLHVLGTRTPAENKATLLKGSFLFVL